MKCICPECKNNVDMAEYPKAAVGHIIECPTCGITLEITEISPASEVITEVVDEMK
jgi:endogenous inhibitor of DNA gyrase (YacG/DUF329 family)